MSDPPSAALLAAYEAEYALDEPQRAALALAGEHLDRAAMLDAAVTEHGVMVAGSAGQLVLNPAVAEARQQRAAAWTILRALVPDPENTATDAASLGQADEGTAQRSTASARAARAASARWERARATKAAG